MNTIRNILRLVFLLFIFVACSNEKIENLVDLDNAEELTIGEDASVSADLISTLGNETRSLWSFDSENLSITRKYEANDIMYILNPYLPKIFWDMFPASSKHYNWLYYQPSTNKFKGTAAWYTSFTPPKTLGPTMADADSLQLCIIDKNYADWDYDVAQDTSMILGLTKQKGTQLDAFAHQLIYLYLPRSLYNGTHLWTQTIMAYYWLIFTFPDRDVASIDTIRVHADEPMPSKVAWKYKGYLAKNYTEYNGPYAVGTNSFSSTGADAFIAFYTGNGTATFNNFGFDISYTLTDGTKHKGSSNVRPQVKTAAAGNLYKNAFAISKAHGVQNTYVDEIVEVDKWNNAYNGTVIAPKSPIEIDVDPTEAE